MASIGVPPAADVSVVVVNYNTAHLLHEMWAALERARDGLNLQAIAMAGSWNVGANLAQVVVFRRGARPRAASRLWKT